MKRPERPDAADVVAYPDIEDYDFAIESYADQMDEYVEWLTDRERVLTIAGLRAYKALRNLGDHDESSALYAVLDRGGYETT